MQRPGVCPSANVCLVPAQSAIVQRPGVCPSANVRRPIGEGEAGEDGTRTRFKGGTPVRDPSRPLEGGIDDGGLGTVDGTDFDTLTPRINRLVAPIVHDNDMSRRGDVDGRLNGCLGLYPRMPIVGIFSCGSIDIEVSTGRKIATQ